MHPGPLDDYKEFMEAVDSIAIPFPRCRACGSRSDIEWHRFPWDKQTAIALCGVCSEHAHRIHDRHEITRMNHG